MHILVIVTQRVLTQGVLTQGVSFDAEPEVVVIVAGPHIHLLPLLELACREGLWG